MKVTTHYVAFWALLILISTSGEVIWQGIYLVLAVANIIMHGIVARKGG